MRHIIIVVVLLLATVQAFTQTLDNSVDISIGEAIEGGLLAFTAERETGRELFVSDMQTGEVCRLTDGRDVFTVGWSPDGQWIYYQHSQNYQEYYLVRYDGSIEVRLPDDTRFPLYFSPDSQEFITHDLAYRIRTDGSFIPLDNLPAGNLLMQGWEDNGEWVVIVDTLPAFPEMFRFSLVTGEKQSFEGYIGDSSGEWELFSPNREYTVTNRQTPIVKLYDVDIRRYGACVGTVASVAFLEAVGRDYTEADFVRVRWSPDGEQIALMAEVIGSVYEDDDLLFVVNRDGTNVRFYSKPFISDFHWVNNQFLQVREVETGWTASDKIMDVSQMRVVTSVMGDVVRSWWQPNDANSSFACVDSQVTQNLEAEVIRGAFDGEACIGQMETRLAVGMIARVTISNAGETPTPLRVRQTPAGEFVESMAEGTVFSVIGGPFCADALTWWEIETADGSLTGWSAEGDGVLDYFMEPVDSSP